MKIIKFPEETNANVISRAYKEIFKKHNIPKEEQKEAKKWHFVIQEVSHNMFPKVIGRPTPIINRGLKPSREVVRMSYIRDRFPTIYPYHLKTDKDKFAHLRKALIKKQISVKDFKMLSSVLEIKEKAIEKAIRNTMVNQFGSF